MAYLRLRWLAKFAAIWDQAGSVIRLGELIAAFVLIGVGVFPVHCPAQASMGTVVLSGQVIGRVFGWPEALAPPAGAHQEVALVRLPDGTTAVAIYRFVRPTDRLPHSFFEATESHALNAVPVAGCPAHLRDVVFLRTTDPKTGAPSIRLTLARLPGVAPETISAHLDDAVSCYLAGPGSLVSGGGQ